MEGYRQDIDFIAGIIRQELQAVYQIEEIKAVVEQQANRIAKMHMKSGKMDAAAFFLLVKVLMNMAQEGTTEQFDQMLGNAIALGVDYMKKKDFQIYSGGSVHSVRYVRELPSDLPVRTFPLSSKQR